jgi:uncharacterized protein (PEP-CTERM system associated)
MQLGQNCLKLSSLLCVLCGWSLAGGVLALEWDGNISVAPGLVYTDNVCLTKNDKKGDFTGIATATPFGSVRAQTSRTTFSASGSVSVNTLTNGDLRDDGCSGNALGDRQKWFPRLNSSLNTVLLSNWVKLDAKLQIDQNDISSARRSSNDGLDRTGNANTYYRYSLSPYMSRRLAGRSTYSLRYTFNHQLNSADTVSDSYRHSVNTSLTSDQSSQLTYGLTGRYSRTSYSDDVFNITTGVATPREDTTLRSAAFRSAYQIGRRWQVNGTIGWEWNDFQTVSNNDTGGAAWDLGARWTPSPRTTVSVGMGDRFFGKTPRLDFRHVRKRSSFSGSYNKRITFQRDLSTQGFGSSGGSGLFGGTDSSGGGELFDDSDSTFGGADGAGQPIGGSNTNSSITSNGLILDERFTLRYSYKGRPGTLTAWGSYSRQTRAEDDAEADYKDWQIAFTPNLSEKFSVVGSIAFQEIVPAGIFGDSGLRDFADSENWYYTLSYRRRLNTRLNLNLTYRFTDRRSDEERNEYQENMVRATLNIAL